MNTKTDDGSTKTPADDAELAAKRQECQGIRAHYWKWVWELGEWTNKVRCTTCGEEKDMKRFGGQ